MESTEVPSELPRFPMNSITGTMWCQTRTMCGPIRALPRQLPTQKAKAGASSDPRQTHPRTRITRLSTAILPDRKLTGTGERLEYADYDSTFLELIGTKISDQSVVLERDQTKRNYLHPVAGSETVRVDAGLFMKPIA